jgi:hypothetical protein
MDPRILKQTESADRFWRNPNARPRQFRFFCVAIPNTQTGS